MMFDLVSLQASQSPRFAAALPEIKDVPQEPEAFKPNTVYAKMAPCFYENYVPFARFEPAAYQTFDRL